MSRCGTSPFRHRLTGHRRTPADREPHRSGDRRRACRRSRLQRVVDSTEQLVAHGVDHEKLEPPFKRAVQPVHVHLLVQRVVVARPTGKARVPARVVPETPVKEVADHVENATRPVRPVAPAQGDLGIRQGAVGGHVSVKRLAKQHASAEAQIGELVVVRVDEAMHRRRRRRRRIDARDVRNQAEARFAIRVDGCDDIELTHQRRPTVSVKPGVVMGAAGRRCAPRSRQGSTTSPPA